MLGGAGDDVLIGGPGQDVLDGGTGGNVTIQVATANSAHTDVLSPLMESSFAATATTHGVSPPADAQATPLLAQPHV